VYVARVGDAVLTESDLARAGSAQSQHFARQYVSNWVTSELLYQEARRAGFTEAHDVVQQVEQAKRQLAINAFIEKEVYGDDSASVSERDIENEFNANREAYRLRDDVVRLSFAIFDERDAANAFRSKLLRGQRWADALNEIASSPDASERLLRKATDDYFTQATLYPEELWKIARALTKEDVSYVVKTNAGYCVAVVHAGWRQGEIPELAYVRNEVKDRIVIDRRRAKYNDLLERLRSKYDVDVQLSSLDTTATE
jgi:hypothetical protein